MSLPTLTQVVTVRPRCEHLYPMQCRGWARRAAGTNDPRVWWPPTARLLGFCSHRDVGNWSLCHGSVSPLSNVTHRPLWWARVLQPENAATCWSQGSLQPSEDCGSERGRAKLKPCREERQSRGLRLWVSVSNVSSSPRRGGVSLVISKNLYGNRDQTLCFSCSDQNR